MDDSVIKNELVTLGKKFTLLYVEDEDVIRTQMQKIFSSIFKEVHIGVDGEHGLELYKRHEIDLVITDIEMPKMNGLDMAREIRTFSYDIPITIISAFQDSNIVAKSIDVSVTKYIFKPIDKDNLLHSLHEVVKNLQNKLDAKQLQREHQLQKLNEAVQNTTQDFLKSVPSPIFVIQNNKVIYMNSHLHELLLNKDIDVNSEVTVNTLESIFEPYQDSKYKFSDMKEGKNTDINFRYNISKKSSVIYTPVKHKIQDKKYIVILNDITQLLMQVHMINYQKQKLESNKYILEEFLDKNIFIKTQEEKTQTEDILKKISFEEDIELLRRTHIYKINASDYNLTLSDTIQDDLDELNELELDIQSELYELEYSQQASILQTIASILQKYAHTLVRLIEFSDLAEAVRYIASYISKLGQAEVDKNIYMIKIVLESILNDLSNWKESVFISQNTNDIHYLDSSLYNTIVELRNSIEETHKDTKLDNQDDDDDLEFF